jgi:hypothetical protein
MMRRLAINLLLAGVSLWGEVDETRWQHHAPVRAFGNHPYASVSLGAETWRRSEASLRDLRLVDANGSEVPYVLRGPDDTADSREYVPSLIDRVRTPGGALQFVLDFGATRAEHNLLRLRWTDRNFQRAYLLESSERGQRWDEVKRGTLLDFESDGTSFRTETIEYPVSVRRFLRLTVENWPDVSTLASVLARRRPEGPPPWVRVGAATHRPDVGIAREQVIAISLPFRPPDRLRLAFETGEGDYVRPVRIETEASGGRWIEQCTGTLARVGENRQEYIECRSLIGRELRARIQNGDNAPLAVRSVAVLALEQTMVFPLSHSAPYRLLAGNATAAAPRYDLEEILRRNPADQFSEGALGDWGPNPKYVPPEPLVTEQAKTWLTALLGVILLGIVITAQFLIRTARRRTRAKTGPA